MSGVSASNLSGGSSGAEVEETRCGTKFVIPRYWIQQNAGAPMIITLKIKLSGCTKDRIKIQIWNWRQLLVLAACQFRQYKYKLEYELPPGARILFPPKFAAHTGILICRYSVLNRACVVCHASFPLRPIVTKAKDTSGSVLNRPGVEFVQPRHWVTYDGNAALFEAHLKGCKSSSQINFHIANDKVIILAVLSNHLCYFLGLRLESSAQSNWKAYFDRKMEMFTCSIPLLGHYECGKCLAKLPHVGEGSSKEKAVKSVGTQTDKVSSGYPSGSDGQEF